MEMTVRWPCRLLLVFLAGALLAQCRADTAEIEIVNPYEDLDWQDVDHHRAELHAHTLQSDGYHMLDEVLREYETAGFSIMAITDHDWVPPNRHVRQGTLPEEMASPYPDPRPAVFPANNTWPWTDYGAPSPEEVGMFGIEGSELSSRHHMNSFFNDYGVADLDDPPGDDEQITEVGRRGGVVFLDHPGIMADWWERRPREWYVERYQNHPLEVLAGLEISGGGYYDYEMSLWDQLLDEFMPDRPIWGFSTSDMHQLESVQFGFTVFLLDRLSEESIKEAMQAGRFYFVRGEERVDLTSEGNPYDGAYPHLHSVQIDQSSGEIVIEASGYDEIVWISNPASNEELEDFRVSDQPWPAGEIVQRGERFNYSESPEDRTYVRAEVIRHTDQGPVRLFTNPFGLVHVESSGR